MFLVRDFPFKHRSRRGPEETRESSVRKPSLICGHLETGLLPDEIFFYVIFLSLFFQFFCGGSIFCLFLLKWWFFVDRQKLPSGLLGKY